MPRREEGRGQEGRARRSKHICKGHNECKGQGGCASDAAKHRARARTSARAWAAAAAAAVRARTSARARAAAGAGDRTARARTRCKGKGGCEVPVGTSATSRPFRRTGVRGTPTRAPAASIAPGARILRERIVWACPTSGSAWAFGPSTSGTSSPGSPKWTGSRSSPRTSSTPAAGPLHVLDQVAERYPVVLHGVSLSIGSIDPARPRLPAQAEGPGRAHARALGVRPPVLDGRDGTEHARPPAHAVHRGGAAAHRGARARR